MAAVFPVVWLRGAGRIKGLGRKKRDRDESEKERGWRGADYAHTVTNP